MISLRFWIVYVKYVAGSKFAPTFSIGVACEGTTLEELIQNANKSLYLSFRSWW